MDFGMTGTRRLVVDNAAGAWGNTVAIDGRYRPLVGRLERMAAEDPRLYRNRVLLGAALGYGFVIAVALLLVGLCIGIVALMVTSRHVNALEVKLLIVFGAIAWAVLASLHVRFEPPEGRTVHASEAPALFALIEDLRARIGGPKIHEVLITGELNAAILQNPRLGMFGWYRNCLIIGLPLLQSLTKEEVAAIIGHELGHFAGQHGRLSSAIYRVRMIWAQLSERLREGHSANLLRRFFRWYGPWFNAYSFVLARSNEYEADAAAAAATRPGAIAGALIRLTIQSDRYDGHWERVYEDACKTPQPSRLPYSSSAAMFAAPADERGVRRSLAEALAARTDLHDTHPCLTDRLAALGADPVMPPPIDEPASASLLGGLADEVAAELDEQWWRNAAEWWREVGAEHAEETAELAALDEAAAAGELDRERQLRRADLTRSIRSGADALPLYRAILAADPSDEEATFFAGTILLGEDDAGGARLLERLAAASVPYAAPCHAELARFHQRNGDSEAAARSLTELEKARVGEELADEEARQIDQHATILPPLQSPAELELLREQAERLAGVEEAYLGSRWLEQGLCHQQILIFAPTRGTDPQPLVDEIGSWLLPYGGYIGFSVAPDTRWLLEKMKQVEGTRLCPR